MSSLSFPSPTITRELIEKLYSSFGVDRAVVCELASDHETPETVRNGYDGAYLSFFESCGLSFPIPRQLLEILAGHGISLTQLCPNLLRHLLAILVRAREEKLLFELEELHSLYLIKRNQKNPGTILASPRPGLHVIGGTPYRDDQWRDQFFVFKVDSSSVGDFDFSLLLRRWAETIAHPRVSPVSDQLRGTVAVLKRGDTDWSSFTRERIRTLNSLPVGLSIAPPISGPVGLLEEAERSDHEEPTSLEEIIVRPNTSHSERCSFRRSLRTRASVSRKAPVDPTPISLGSDSEEDMPAREHGSARAWRSVSTRPSRAAPKTSKRRRVRRSDRSPLYETSSGPKHDGTSSQGFGRPLFSSLEEEDAYTKVAEANAKVMEVCNDLVLKMAERTETSQRDAEIDRISLDFKRISAELEIAKRENKEEVEKINSMMGEWVKVCDEKSALEVEVAAQRTKIARLEAERDRDVRSACREMSRHYAEILKSLEEKWSNKERETAARIQLQEVIANISLLDEIKEGSCDVDGELARLQDLERDCEAAVESCPSSSWTISELDLPRVPEELDLGGPSNAGGDVGP
ncbi:uncharacterized protein At3g60930, chloroplastic-like [Raphanus sativus]|uniref:Uncharacterized protein At3g60930, chloroplastic-like n=1 Tax=Raphanus sativus TaxID=3726 RepID=A0A6J0N4G5_RAPSA|nr:uncharacterized protein At3g60930, chloroplastic-like [Raphanus sativus]